MLREGNGTFRKPLTGRKRSGAMRRTYERMSSSGVKHLFEDLDARSTVGAEAAMMRAKEIQVHLNNKKEGIEGAEGGKKEKQK